MRTLRSSGSSRGLEPVLVVLLLLAGLPARSAAQAQSGAQSLFINPSIRADGMGRTGVAVFWGGDPNGWVNPALFAYHQGVRFQYGKTQLVPELAEDVTFTSDVITLGACGVGLYIAGKPIDGLGGLRLNYGKSLATDVDGNIIGEFTSYEEIDAFGFGVSAAQLLESAARAIGWDPPLISRYGDVSFGQTWKSVIVDLAPASVTMSGVSGYGESENRDHGLFARITPYNSVNFPGTLPGVEKYFRARIDASYGTAAVNFDNDQTITYLDGSTDPLAKDSHWGWAFRADLALPARAEESLRTKRLGWIAGLIAPILSFGVTSEHSQYAIQDAKVGQEIDLTGWELEILNIFSLRNGHINDPTGTVIGDTSGWGVGLEFGKLGGLRYDKATVPQSIYLGDVTREGYTIYVDPVELGRRIW